MRKKSRRIKEKENCRILFVGKIKLKNIFHRLIMSKKMKEK
jgi:hypothetical protein